MMTLTHAFGLLKFDDGVQVELEGKAFYLGNAKARFGIFPVEMLANAVEQRTLISIEDDVRCHSDVFWHTDEGVLGTLNVEDTAGFMFDKLAIGRGN